MSGLTLTEVLHFQQVGDIRDYESFSEHIPASKEGKLKFCPESAFHPSWLPSSCKTASSGQRSPVQEEAQPQAGPQPGRVARGLGAMPARP